MLNFSSLKPQIDRMIEERRALEDKFLEKINLAQAELTKGSDNWEALYQKLRLSKTSWLIAGISGRLDVTHPLPPHSSNYTVFASDGSQIFPDRHEAFSCYLINIGYVVLHYGPDGSAKLDSYPRFFYQDEDRLATWDGRKIPADSAVISERRNLMEFEEVLRQIENDHRNKDNSIAICDGTLIFWRLEGTPADFKNEIIAPFLDVLDKLKSLRVPIAGYISFPGSTDVINSLRVWLCPDEVSYCSRCPYTHLPELPCSPIEGVTDRLLFSRVLKPGERSAVFMSSSQILEHYREHAIHFFYINLGPEIARVEIPKWVAEDDRLLNLVHAVVFDQAKKGGGYPISLAEAHEQAVVRAKERDFFFELIREALVRGDFRVAASRKGLSKRSPGV